MTDEECKKVLFRCGIKYGVSPKLIALRLLSDDDKNDMREGLLPIASLECAIEAWIDAGYPDYAGGNSKPWVDNRYMDSFKTVVPVLAALSFKK